MAKSDTVALFVTCLVDSLRPSVGFATVALLEKLGYQVEVPLQSCCGQPAFNSGDFDSARLVARQWIETFEGFDAIVAPSGSCVGMIKHYPELLSTEPTWAKRAQACADKTHELCQFLANNSQLNSLPQVVVRSQEKISYHDSCAGLRELGVKAEPRQLLKQLAGIKITEADNAEVCCGFGGTFCVKQPEISVRLADNKINGFIAQNADTIVGGDMGCLMHLQARLQREGHLIEVKHVAEVLSQALDGEDA